MKDEYDSSNAEQGRFYVPAHEIEIPIYLDPDVFRYLLERTLGNAGGLQSLVNDLLRRDIEIAKQLEAGSAGPPSRLDRKTKLQLRCPLPAHW